MQSNICRNSIICALLIFVYCAPVSRADNIKPVQPTNDENKTAPVSGIIDDSDPGWIFNGFTLYEDPNLKNGNGHAGGPGSYAAFTFNGTSVDVIGLSAPGIKIDGRPKRLGRAKISIDGKTATETNVQTKEINYDYNITTITGLQKGLHVLQIDSVGGWVVIDYIKVGNPDDDKDKLKNGPKTLIPGKFIPEGDYYLSASNAVDKFLEPVNGGIANDTKLEIYAFDANRIQGWHVTRFENGYYRLSPLANPDAALTFVPKTADPKKQLAVLWEFGNYPSQIFAIVPKPNNLYEIRIANDNTDAALCLDVLDRKSVNGTQVINFGFWGGDNQLWRFTPLESMAQ